MSAVGDAISGSPLASVVGASGSELTISVGTDGSTASGGGNSTNQTKITMKLSAVARMRFLFWSSIEAA